MRFAELFAGAGGLSLGLEQAGHECRWHCEIEPHARAVLRARWPDVPLYGDVSTLDGKELVARHGPIDLLSGGSPCQDLSVAGKRAGLEGARSGLFHQQLRLWQETGADLLLWENVMGALSSGDPGGADFQTVLEALSGTDLIRPDDGWPTAGVVRGADGRARVAYRCLDLQWFGPPQRRRRVFVLAVRPDALDRYDPAALLFADTAGGRAGTPYRPEVQPVREGVSGNSAASGTAGEGTAAAAGAGAGDCYGISPEVTVGEDIMPNLTQPSVSGGGHPATVAFGVAWWDGRDTAPTLDQSQLVKGQMMPDKDRFPVVMALNNDSRAAGTAEAPPLRGGARSQASVVAPHPRRLTPLETERLMGWPDGWTATGVNEKGITYALADSARYRLCGNGVGSPCTRWIGSALAAATAAAEEAA